MSDNPESKKHETSSSINVGNITNATGVAVGHGAQATVTQIGASKDEIAKAFAPILEKVNALPDGPDKGMAKAQ